MKKFLICFIGAGRNEKFQKLDLTQNLNRFSAKINSAKSEKIKESPIPPEKNLATSSFDWIFYLRFDGVVFKKIQKVSTKKVTSYKTCFPEIQNFCLQQASRDC